MTYGSLIKYICGIHCENSKNNGTAFVIQNKDKKFLVTAGHVVRNQAADSISILINMCGKPMLVPSSYFSECKEIFLYQHADIAALPLKEDSPFINTICPLQIDQLQDPVQGTELAFVGFSNIAKLNYEFKPAFFDTQNFSYQRNSRADDKSLEQDFLLLDVQSHEGTSGGAVFFGEKPYVAGIIHGGNASMKKTAVTPIKYLKDMLSEL